jgi:hypothetical protein
LQNETLSIALTKKSSAHPTKHAPHKILFPEEQSVSTLFQGALIPRLVTSESLGITSLVASIVDFFTVIEAESFVGVKGSTFSTDLFSARYYMGKGGNFILSPKGLDPLIGPAPPHSC